MNRRTFLLSASVLLGCADGDRANKSSVALPPPPPGDPPNEDPIPPSDMARMIGRGLATSWFKVEPLGRDYRKETLSAVRARGFSNLRLRCRADVFGFARDTLDLPVLEAFLKELERVVDDCLAADLIPIVSWIHHSAEADARAIDGDNYVAWWTAVATRLRNRSHKLVLNLFTEIGDGNLRKSNEKYNDWTRRVVTAIRTSGGLNNRRILILGAPGKTARSLTDIDASIYQNDPYIMAEWHLFASGPNHGGGQKEWNGPQDPASVANVQEPIAEALAFTQKSGLRTYLGAWMPWDNADGSLSQAEIESFADYFPKALGKANIPWSLNELAHVYDERAQAWMQSHVAGGKTIAIGPVLERMLA